MWYHTIAILPQKYNTRKIGLFMLTYDFGKREKTSLYEYLYKCIKEDILSGKIKANEKLPSKREMAKNHDISVITVENSYAQLIV